MAVHTVGPSPNSACPEWEGSSQAIRMGWGEQGRKLEGQWLMLPSLRPPLGLCTRGSQEEGSGPEEQEEEGGPYRSLPGCTEATRTDAGSPPGRHLSLLQTPPYTWAHGGQCYRGHRTKEEESGGVPGSDDTPPGWGAGWGVPKADS